jgi:hypothetical protein
MIFIFFLFPSGAVRSSQFTGDLGLRLPAGFDKAHRFDLEFLGGRFWLFCMALALFVELSLSSLLPPQRWAIVIQSFAAGIEKDKDAVKAGLTWWINNGMVEGHVTKLKLIKRHGYGRAGFPLLRKRVLHAL